jgi:hypothetical protein
MKKSLAITALFCLASAGAFGSDLGVNLPSSYPNYGTSVWNLGFSFQANSNASVVGLGNFFDGSDDDYDYGSQQVGLWTSGGTLLASTYVSPSDPVTDSAWIFNAISPVELTAGNEYVVGGQGGWDYTGVVVGATYSPDISFITDLYSYTGTGNSPLTFPVDSEGYGSGASGWFGGNIELASSVAATPEPGSFLLLGSGLVAMIGVARRRRAASRS